ncbi:hypothetical protein NUU61_009498 [Penicillium alfredii]|uniref:FAD dependent oxidoreductase domain-containing protein n=1 Tax=Penicillium alfredii TaxID=1506179 RepID=A0A9W9ENE5_9EURO|nr:uncharacterized protein NUU61_009498 [Penicillium alfredii]KAJ5084919.1 hypothetical protein NUU61_009498 [Penicillium alfredii]
MDKNERIVIVGAGAFGLSTALTLVQQGYNSVTVLDRSMPPVPDGSSDPVYARIAKEAYDLWKTPEYQDAFHSTPCQWVCQDSTPEQPVQPRAVEYIAKTKRILTDMGQDMVAVRSTREAKQHFPRLMGKMADRGFGGFYNTQLMSRCASVGLSLVTGPSGQVEEFEKAIDGTITAVCTKSGNKIQGDRFIVATGAWTASLVPARNSMLAAAQVVGYLQLTPEEVAQLKDLPIYFNFSTGFFCFPAHESTGYLKVAIHGFGYTSTSPSSVFAPPSSAVATRANFVPADGVQRLVAGLKDFLPHFAPRGFERVGLCWYNDTPTGDFIMDYQPEPKNLFIATGGSGHGFKFLPVIGNYIVGSRQRSLPQDLLDKWTFPVQFRERFQGDAFMGDGSRGGPERRELRTSERDAFNAALTASSWQPSKI